MKRILVFLVVASASGAAAEVVPKTISDPATWVVNDARCRQVVALLTEPTDEQDSSDAVAIAALGNYLQGWSDARGVSVAFGTAAVLTSCKRHPDLDLSGAARPGK